jgi:hypothetical protein
MRRLLGTMAVVTMMTLVPTGRVWSQGRGGGPSVVSAAPAPGAMARPPVFASAYGPSQGYGYAPATSWVGPAQVSLHFWSYFDGTVSSPYRPGSTNFPPRVGYFSTGCGPVWFDQPW